MRTQASLHKREVSSKYRISDPSRHASDFRCALRAAKAGGRTPSEVFCSRNLTPTAIKSCPRWIDQFPCPWMNPFRTWRSRGLSFAGRQPIRSLHIEPRAIRLELDAISQRCRWGRVGVLESSVVEPEATAKPESVHRNRMSTVWYERLELLSALLA